MSCKYLTLYINKMNIYLKKETTINMTCMQRDAKVVDCYARVILWVVLDVYLNFM